MDLDQRTFGLFSKLFLRGWNDCFLRLNRSSFSIVFPKVIITFLYQFWTLSDYFLAFCRKFFDGAVTTAIFISIRTFPCYIIFEIPIKISISVSDLERIILAFCRKFTENVFFWKKNYAFIRGPWAKWFSFLSKSFRRSCENCMPCVHKNTSTANFFRKKICFCSISDIERTFLTLYWNFFDEVLKTASYVFKGSFWWKKFFDEKLSIF